MSEFENPRVHFSLVTASHVTMTSWVKNIAIEPMACFFYGFHLWVIDLQRMRHVTMV